MGLVRISAPRLLAAAGAGAVCAAAAALLCIALERRAAPPPDLAVLHAVLSMLRQHSQCPSWPEGQRLRPPHPLPPAAVERCRGRGGSRGRQAAHGGTTRPASRSDSPVMGSLNKAAVAGSQRGASSGKHSIHRGVLLLWPVGQSKHSSSRHSDRAGAYRENALIASKQIFTFRWTGARVKLRAKSTGRFSVMESDPHTLAPALSRRTITIIELFQFLLVHRSAPAAQGHAAWRTKGESTSTGAAGAARVASIRCTAACARESCLMRL